MSFNSNLLQGAIKFGLKAMGLTNENNPAIDPQVTRHLKSQLDFCTYEPNVMQQVLKASEQFIDKNQGFVAQVRTFDQSYNVLVLLELVGQIEVNSAGKSYPISMKILFPVTFPKSPPLFVIVNPDLQRFETSHHYQEHTLPQEKDSYSLNPMLVTVKSWNKSTTLSEVINDAKSLMSCRFPFSKRRSNQPKSNQSGWAFGANQNRDNNPYNPNQNSQTNSINTNLYGKPSEWQEPGANQNPNINQEWFQTKKLNQKQQKAKQQIEDYIVRGVSFREETDNLLSIMNPRQVTVQRTQNLEILSLILSDQIQTMDSSIQRMEKLVRQNSDIEQTLNLAEVVEPNGPLSNQLLDLVSETKTFVDMYIFLESQFSKEQISFEVLVKQIKKLEESKFQANCTIKKIVKTLANRH